MGPGDQAVLVLHQPIWLVGWFWGHATAKNLAQLVRGPLHGRARIALAGMHLVEKGDGEDQGRCRGIRGGVGVGATAVPSQQD